MWLRSILAQQFGRPSGLIGPFMARTLNRVNARVNAIALECLAPAPADHVLDVGFGGGLMLRQVLPLVPRGGAAGIEISQPMLSRARRNFRSEIQSGRLEIAEASVSSIPFADNRFDKAASINTLHFWPDPPSGFRELLRVLKPGGLLVVVTRPKEFLEKVRFTEHGFAVFTDAQMRELLQSAGFANVRIEHREDAGMGMVLTMAAKPHARRA